jgi:hypothetical protein
MNQSATQPQRMMIYKEVHIFTDVDILVAGLFYAGFDTRRQEKNNIRRNMTRYKQFYGVNPSTAAPLFRDLRNEFPSFNYKDGLMTLNWLYLNDKQSVLSGRWKCSKETIGTTVKKYAKMIQSLIKKKIKFVFTHEKRHIASIDCYNFTTNEFCQDPSGRWFDHKSNSSGPGMSFASWPNDIHLSFPVIFLTNNSSLSKRNMKPAWISGKEGLYRSEDPLHQQHMTCQFFVEAKRKF